MPVSPSTEREDGTPVAGGAPGLDETVDSGAPMTLLDESTSRLIEAGALSVRSGRDGTVHVLELYGELDLASVGALEEEMRRAEASDARRILIDLSGLEFIDSTGICALVRAHHRQRAEPGDRLGLLRAVGQPQRVIELTGIDKRLRFVD
jgi:anti-sigma B factor antagonist